MQQETHRTTTYSFVAWCPECMRWHVSSFGGHAQMARENVSLAHARTCKRFPIVSPITVTSIMARRLPGQGWESVATEVEELGFGKAWKEEYADAAIPPGGFFG